MREDKKGKKEEKALKKEKRKLSKWGSRGKKR